MFTIQFDSRLLRTLLAGLLVVLRYNCVEAQDRCGSMEVLERKWSANPSLKAKFLDREGAFQQLVKARIQSGKTMRNGGLVTIPVVFHLVLTRQSLVTDKQIQAQLDTLNNDFAGLNGSARSIPAYFQSLFGQTGIQFCMAQLTPSGEPTSGILRYNTTQSPFDYRYNNMKYSSLGGADAWDTDSYFNIWVCDLSDSVLGFATFPNDGVKREQGVVITPSCLPGGSATSYNRGKTLTHETGHYFNLYHIWGDDNGACWGTDYVDDTPNQAIQTTSCRSGVVTDNCTTSSPGIMYQNYMDYTPDGCLTMFTKQQVVRMETAFNTYRSLMASSRGCIPPDLKTRDVYIRAISQPDQRLCSGSFAPVVTIRNMGTETLTRLTVRATLEDGSYTTYNWSGSLTSYGEATFSLPSMTVAEGEHVLIVSGSLPNGQADEDTSNDNLTKAFIYYGPFQAPVNEGFEVSFPSAGWDIVNEDGGSTWERSSSASKTGTYAARIRNSQNTSVGQKDYLRTPTVTISGVDSAFVSFQVAAATYTSIATANNVWDTLQVLISTDCGKTYNSIYKKWGSTLVTRQAATRTSFVPTATEWRKEEIDISKYSSSGDVMLAFLNINGNENDIYLDNINIRTVTVNPNLKESGFLVTPNPASGIVEVQFYPQPTNLKGVYIYSATGQAVAEVTIESGVGSSYYSFNMARYSSGVYIVKAVFADKVLTKKIVKL